MHYLKKLLESGVLSDVSFSVGEEQEIIKAHKCILAVRSPVFLAMFDGNFKESSTTEEEEETRIQLPDSTPAAFKEFLGYIYLDEEMPLHEDNWAPILYLADKYDLPQLKKRSIEFVRKVCYDYNVCSFYSEARNHCVLSHVDFIKVNMHHYTVNSLNSDSFLLIHYNEIICEIISMDELDCYEIQIFRAAIRWASYKIPGDKKDGPELRRILGRALFAIRFPRISLSNLEKEVIPSGILSQQEIISIFCNKNNLDEGINSIDFPSHSRITFFNCIGIFIHTINSKHCSIQFQVDKELKIHGYEVDCSSAEGAIILKSGNEIVREENIVHQYTYGSLSSYFYFDSPVIIEPHTPYTASLDFNSAIEMNKYVLPNQVEKYGVTWTIGDTKPKGGSIRTIIFRLLE